MMRLRRGVRWILRYETKDKEILLEHHLDEGMKEVLVYSRTNTDGHVDREKVPKIEVEVDLAGSHSRLARGTESPLRINYK